MALDNQDDGLSLLRCNLLRFWQQEFPSYNLSLGKTFCRALNLMEFDLDDKRRFHMVMPFAVGRQCRRLRARPLSLHFDLTIGNFHPSTIGSRKDCNWVGVLIHLLTLHFVTISIPPFLIIKIFIFTFSRFLMFLIFIFCENEFGEEKIKRK